MSYYDFGPHECSFSSGEVGEGLHSLAAGRSRLVEEGSHPAAEEELRIRLAAAEEDIPAVDRNRLAAGHSHPAEEGSRPVAEEVHHIRLAEEERRIREVHPGRGLTFRPWCRTRDQL